MSHSHTTLPLPTPSDTQELKVENTADKLDGVDKTDKTDEANKANTQTNQIDLILQNIYRKLAINSNDTDIPLGITALENRGATIDTPFQTGPAQGYSLLQLSITNDKENVLRKLVEYGASVDAPFLSGKYQGYRPLHLAIEYGHEHLVKVLIDLKANINLLDTTNNSRAMPPIIKAIKLNRIACVKYLVDAGIDPRAPVTDGYFKGATPLCISASNGILPIVEYLFTKGAREEDINTSAQEGVIKGSTPLFLAVRAGHMEITRFLVNHGGNLNSPCFEGSFEGSYPLHAEIERKNYASFQALVALEPKLDIVPANGKYKGFNVLCFAVRMFCERAMTLPDAPKSGSTASVFRQFLLKVAPTDKHLIEIDKIIKHLVGSHPSMGIDAPMTSGIHAGLTPVLVAAHENNPVDIIILTALYGADLNGLIASEKWKGFTPLLVALFSETRVLATLIACGANVNATYRQQNGNTIPIIEYPAKMGMIPQLNALHKGGAEITDEIIYSAVFTGQTQVLQLLLEWTKSKGNINTLRTSDQYPGYKGLSLLYVAAKNNWVDGVKSLLACGADVNAVTNKCEEGVHKAYPLYIAALLGHAEIVGLLLAQPDIILHINPEHSRSPLDAATLKGHHAIVKQLNTALIKQKVKQLELIQSTQPKDKKAPESKTLLPDSKEQIFETDKNAQRISDKAKKKQAKKARQAQSQDNKIENTKLVLSKIKNNITKLVESISTFLNDMTDRNFSNNEEKVVEFKATKTQFNTEKTTLKDQYENHIPEADETNEEAYLTKLLDKLNELKTKIISYQGKLYDFVKELEETKRKQRNPDIKKSGTAKKIQTERIADHLRQRQEEREKTKREAEEQKKELKRVSQIRRDQVQKAAAQVKQAVTVVEESKNTEVDTSTATPRKLSGTRRASQITIEVKETRSNKQNLSLRQRIGIMIEHLINMHGILSYYVANEKPADKNYDNTLLSALIYNFIRYAEATKRIIKSVDDPSGKLNSQILDNFRNMLMHNDIFQINPEVVIETAKQFCEHIPTLLRQLRKHNLTESPLSTAQLEQLNLVFGVQEDQQSFAFFQLESTPLFRLLEACHVDDYADGVLEYTLIKIIADRIIPLVKNIQQDRNKVPQGNQTESKVEIENKLSDFQLHALKMLFTFCGELVLQHECKKRIKAIKKSRLNYENFDNIIKIYEFISYCNKNIRNKVGHRFPDCDSEAIAEAYKRMNKIDITPAQLTKKTRIPILVPRSTAVLSENVWGDELPTPTTTQINDEVKDDGRQTLSVKPLDKEPSAEEFIATMFGGVVEPTAIAEPRVPESAAPEIIIPTILQQPVLTNTNSSIQERSADSVVGINQEIKQSSELLPAFNDLMAITQVSPAVPERLATDFLVVPENPLRYLVTIGVNPVKRYYSSAHDELLNLQLKLDTNTRDYCSRILFVPNPEKRLVYEIRMGKDIYTYMNTEPDIGGEQFVEKIAQDLLSKLRKTEKYFPYFLKTVNHGADYLILKQLLCKDGIDRFDVSYTYNPHGTLTGERSTIKCTLMIYGQVLGEAIVVNQDNDSRHKAKAAAAKNAITIIQSCINRVTFEDYTKNYRRLFDSCHPSLMHLNKQNDITGEQKTSLPIPHRDTEVNSNSASRGAQFFTRPQSQRQLWQPSRPRHPSVNLAANPSLSLMPATAQHSALTPAQASALSIYAASQSVAPSIQIIEQAITLNPVYVQVGALQDSNGTSLLFFQPLQVTYVQPTYSQLSQTLPSSSLVLSNMRHGSS